MTASQRRLHAIGFAPIVQELLKIRFQAMANVFLSHKQLLNSEATELHAALEVGVPGITIFRSADIEKSSDWRAAVDEALDRAKCFILLYGSPEEDWSWCFYEAGRFSRKGRKSRPVACLHPAIIKPPSPLANLQSTNEKNDDIRNWLKGTFFRGVRARKPTEEELKEASERIEKILIGMLAREESFKPYIWITPQRPDDWIPPKASDADQHEIDFSNAVVELDKPSAIKLGFAAPSKYELRPFLREIADTTVQSEKPDFWISKFFESLESAVRLKTNFQEEAYFRHESGRVLRPVVVSYANNANERVCKLRVVFVEAFGSPLTDSPALVQRLSIGARLAVRTRLEIIEPFKGHMAELQKKKIDSIREHEMGRQFKVGGRLIEALAIIVREATSHGVRVGEEPPKLFDGLAQAKYEELVHRGTQIWQSLNDAATKDDRDGDYSETERLLGELKQINEDYLALVLPRIEELLVPAKKQHSRL